MVGCQADADALVEEMIEAVRPILDIAVNKSGDPAVQNTAVSALGMAIIVATLRSVVDKAAAQNVAALLVTQFAIECEQVLKECWGERDHPQ